MKPKLYTSLADWWPLLSPPADYAEEAAIYAKYLASGGDQPSRTMVEFGSGGGNNASYLKRQFQMTLVDLSPGMLAVSRALNPECEHIHGDMRTTRLGREFDRVFLHDAICYIATASDLRRTIETAFIHCRPGTDSVIRSRTSRRRVESALCAPCAPNSALVREQACFTLTRRTPGQPGKDARHGSQAASVSLRPGAISATG